MTRTDPPLFADSPADASASAGESVERLVAVIAELREHCLWTAALTHESLITYLIEESYELADVVESDGPADMAELKGELGDILYQVVLHSTLAEESKAFTLADVADHLRNKLVRRNSHVFRPDGSLQDSFPKTIAEIERNYAAAKAAERPGIPDVSAGVFDSLPASLPALALAAKTLDRDPGLDKSGPRSSGENPQTEAELGELLFDVVRGAHSRGLDPERALRLAVRRFQEGH
ncbi:hypothetical protein AL755_05605 [Arthrobacter sp. ERGS1:01]|uniref:MazG nucleotide pyrophosphohydrolase domain-containing protein n=1 Tax=Arthrobacter sp. ERGS1:01 TaxID=1704044 RepID=UPI0006B59D59|nr:MazG nucleotide pyrophosphohydrolase domain-containing protein [Arthrobacter sp. ERGS1:01]ALE05084.1 hypothetical protein AL755_05605 [Arthrobacter sp. ERGS1:01]